MQKLPWGAVLAEKKAQIQLSTLDASIQEKTSTEAKAPAQPGADGGHRASPYGRAAKPPGPPPPGPQRSAAVPEKAASPESSSTALAIGGGRPPARGRSPKCSSSLANLSTADTAAEKPEKSDDEAKLVSSMKVWGKRRVMGKGDGKAGHIEGGPKERDIYLFEG